MDVLEQDIKETWLKRRYISTFFAFFVCLLLISFRMNIGISLLSMVNSSVNLTDPKTVGVSNLSNTLERAVQEESKFDWNSVIQGYILGSSFLGFFLAVTISGTVAEKYGARIVLISGTLISSVCNVMTPFSADCHVYFLLNVQFVRGFSQAAVSVFMANWFPQQERGLLSGIAMTGFSAGIVIGGSLSGVLCESTSIGGWRSVFYSFGIVGIVTSIYFIFRLYEFPTDDPKISSSELNYILTNQENKLMSKRPDVPWKKLMSNLKVYAYVYGQTGQSWAWYQFVSVHPKFLESVLNMSVGQNGVFTSVVFILQIITVLAASGFSFWLQKKKYLGVNKIRKMWNTIACTGYSTCLAVIIISNYNRTATLLCCMMCVPLFGLGALGCMIVPADMSPTFAGTLNGIGTTFAAMNGFIIPLTVGFLLKEEESTSQWTKFFLICIAVTMSSGIIFAVFGSADVQEWNFSDKNVQRKEETQENIDLRIQKLPNSINYM